MQRIRIVSSVYPRPWLPESGRYVANLAEGWSARGIAIDVVSLSTLSERLKTAQRKYEDVSIPGVSVNLVHILGTPFSRLLPGAVRRGLDAFDTRRVRAAMLRGARPDVIYAQFAAAGRHARKAAGPLGVPYVVDLGESNSLLEGPEAVVAENRRVLSSALGAVCVSPRLRDEGIELGGNPDRSQLEPLPPAGQGGVPAETGALARRFYRRIRGALHRPQGRVAAERGAAQDAASGQGGLSGLRSAGAGFSGRHPHRQRPA
jgi:hypothetical protein